MLPYESNFIISMLSKSSPETNEVVLPAVIIPPSKVCWADDKSSSPSPPYVFAQYVVADTAAVDKLSINSMPTILFLILFLLYIICEEISSTSLSQ